VFRSKKLSTSHKESCRNIQTSYKANGTTLELRVLVGCLCSVNDANQGGASVLGVIRKAF